MEDGRGSLDRSGTIHFYDDDEALEKMRLLQDRPGFAAFRTKIGWIKNSAMRLQILDFGGQSFSPMSLALLAYFLPKCTALTEV
jgi:hypothetical protein